MKRLSIAVFALLLSFQAQAADSFKICWSIYVGWMPWGYGAEQNIVDKWADKYGIDIEVVQINDYIESINQYTAGEFDACTMTNMDALTIPAASGVDSTALIVGDFSNGNDGVILRDMETLADVKGQKVNLVELSVSHYLLARGLESVGMSEADVQVVNTSDADMVALYNSGSVSAVTTWNPLLSTILEEDDANLVFDSSQIPGEIMDLLVINTETLAANPKLGKALVGAWYEIMSLMSADSDSGKAARTTMGTASGTDLAGYDSQLASTKMFYQPSDAIALVESEELLSTMQKVAEFSFDHGLLGDGAPDAGFIGIEGPKGIYGSQSNVKLRFDTTYMQMAADGKL
ncbi:putative urea ABC transporter substrate-binding protein [Gilvimarinus sp. SDUM040013]|uniref:Urea ABC transporter substrate-binding protein n=1 Tax=Gilvimarinus gilvus TaxID=3058038 RepID=A0ABU4RTZ6_9GAMM|nr:putative urea ABC transporter substrate-binding protein [Gilvimarinus sp. SDUM040013]MDO3386723.1 putative urea ABC transporter substrate-binding protein [Gilvimarinus sp. SDUM040013]MDX6848347.1 putative urea ABC transporter substrate-binding protein [Gilvimarinus sp. SDUM040013]